MGSSFQTWVDAGRGTATRLEKGCVCVSEADEEDGSEDEVEEDEQAGVEEEDDEKKETDDDGTTSAGAAVLLAGLSADCVRGCFDCLLAAPVVLRLLFVGIVVRRQTAQKL